MITFKARPICAECGATGDSRRFSIYREPLAAYKWLRPLGPIPGGYVYYGEATLARQLCQGCRPSKSPPG